jgi:hypothetical protein
MSGYSPSPRPGGLTALAVLNFIFGGLGLLGLLALVALLGLMGNELKKATKQEIPQAEILYVLILLGVIQSTLLVVSGVGYLGQKRFLGKVMGSIYGIIGLAGTGVSIATMKQFDIGTIIGLIYPVLTLVLLNTTFKDDFPNP